MIQKANELFITMNDFLKTVEEHQQNTPIAGWNPNLPKTAQDLAARLSNMAVFFKPKSVDSSVDENS